MFEWLTNKLKPISGDTVTVDGNISTNNINANGILANSIQSPIIRGNYNPVYDDSVITKQYAKDLFVPVDRGSSHYANVIRNPRFEIDQRAGVYGVASSNYTLDGWKEAHNGTTVAVSQQTFVLGQTDVPYNPKKYYRIVVGSVGGSSNYAFLNHNVENVETFSNDICTLSFYMKADSNKNIAIEFCQFFGTGGSPSSYVTTIGVKTISLSTNWTKYTYTLMLPSVFGKIRGSNNDDCLQFNFWFDCGSSNASRTNSLGQQSGTFDIADVVLNNGNIAMPISWCIRNPQQELMLNQRFYEVFPALVNGSLGSGIDVGGGSLTFFYKTTKRIAPTSYECYDNASSAGKITTWFGGVSTNNITPTNKAWSIDTYKATIYHTAANTSGIQSSYYVSSEL